MKILKELLASQFLDTSNPKEAKNAWGAGIHQFQYDFLVGGHIMKRLKNVVILGSRPALYFPGSSLFWSFKQPLWATISTSTKQEKIKKDSYQPTHFAKSILDLYSHISHSINSNQIHYLSPQNYSYSTCLWEWHCYPHSPPNHSQSWDQGRLPLSVPSSSSEMNIPSFLSSLSPLLSSHLLTDPWASGFNLFTPSLMLLPHPKLISQNYKSQQDISLPEILYWLHDIYYRIFKFLMSNINIYICIFGSLIYTTNKGRAAEIEEENGTLPTHPPRLPLTYL